MLGKLIHRLDVLALGGTLGRHSRQARTDAELKRLKQNCDHAIVVRHAKDAGNPIAALCDRYGSDKGTLKLAGHPWPWPPHTFADYYHMLFGHCRESIRHVFECGLGTNNPAILSSMGVGGRPGASLRVWRDYFPHAVVVGADIDATVLFQEERIRTFYLDQTDPASIAMLWQAAGIGEFDLMIDDGLHTFEAGLCLFENSIAQLAPHGIYVIEDVAPADLVRFQRHFAGGAYHVEYVSMFRPHAPLENNNLVVVRRRSP